MAPWPSKFAKRVRVAGPDQCWEWLGGKAGGYGQSWLNGKKHYAHRLAWQWHHGKEAPPGLCVCHRCDNPSCVNPDHLFLGTPAENTADMFAKGRQPSRAGERNGQAKLRREQVIAILADPRTRREIAAAYGVGQSTIGFIKSRAKWRELSLPSPTSTKTD